MNGVARWRSSCRCRRASATSSAPWTRPGSPSGTCWYHLLNCGFPLKVSGETDFPCMSGTRVGQGRVYVRLGEVRPVDFDAWCAGLAAGRSYVSDGYAHALEFTVDGKAPGDRLELAAADGRRPGEGGLRRPDAAGGGPRGRRPGGGPEARRRHGQPARAEARGRVHGRGRVSRASNWSSTAGSPPGREVPADDRVHELEFACRSSGAAGWRFASSPSCTPTRSRSSWADGRSGPRARAPCGAWGPPSSSGVPGAARSRRASETRPAAPSTRPSRAIAGSHRESPDGS